MTTLIISLLLQYQCPPSIDEVLVRALILRESKGNHSLVSSAGAIGLMQVKPIVLLDYNKEHGTDYTKDDLYEPVDNVTVGIWHLCRWKNKTTYRRYLLEIYYAGYTRWQELMNNPDDPTWSKLEWYTRTIRFRVFVLEDLKKLSGE